MSIKQPSYSVCRPVFAMSTSLQMLMWTWCFTSLVISEDLPNGVPILKEINRVNDDGSYTFGYEAADGSFKIETRDVQGNVKGMFGYIDEAGELKRVSYTANNGTGFQSMSTTTRPIEQDDSSTRRPILILRQPTSTRAPVIQHIPRKTVTSETVHSTTTPVYGEYVKGRKPVMEIILNSASSNVETNTEHNEDIKLTPTPPSLRRILVTRKPTEEATTRRNGKGGNALRRQLGNDQTSRPVDAGDVYPEEGSSRYATPASRFQNPLLSSLLPQATPAYRNQILAQNSGRIPPFLLRPEYPNVDPSYQPPFDPQENPEVTTVTPVPPTSFPIQHRLYPEGPLPNVPVPRRFRPTVPLNEQQFPLPNGQDISRHYRPIPNTPQISPVLQQKPTYPPDVEYNQGHHAVQSLRDELMEYLLQYLQQRTGRIGPGYGNRLPVPPYYNPGYNPYNQNPIQNQYYLNPNAPFNPYVNNYFPYPNQPPFYNPYPNPNVYPNMPPITQPFVPPIGVAPANPYSNVPYTNPNIQYSPQQQITQSNIASQNYNPQITEARIGNPILRGVRPAGASSPTDISQQELFRMLISASTRATPPQSFTPSQSFIPSQSFSSTTETPKRSTQPVRNVQIIGSASETVTHRVTSATPLKDEMEVAAR